MNQGKQNNLQQWLQSINCLESFAQNEILNGMLVYKIITNINPTSLNTMKQLSPSTSTLNRVSNWNILAQQLKRLGIPFSQESKSSIVNGNQQLVIQVVSQLKQFYLRKEKSSQVDISQVDPKKDINDTKSLLETMLILMIRNFSLSSKQAVALLSNQSKYLAHILTKGLKGEFKGIQSFLQQMSKYLQKIFGFCKANQQNVIFFFRSIKPAIISKSELISSLCLQFFNRFLENYPTEQRINIFQTHLLGTYLLTMKRHPSMQSQVIVSMFQTILTNEKTSPSKNKQTKIKQTEAQMITLRDNRGKVMKSVFGVLNSDSQKYLMVLGMIKSFGQMNKLEQLMKIQLFSQHVQKSIQSIKQQQHSHTCIGIVLCLNQFLPQIFSTDLQEQNQQQYHLNPRDISQTLIQNLRSVTFPTHSIPFTIQLFTLLHQFGQSKHFIAPSLYKLLVQKFQEVQDINSDIYTVFLDNFIETIKQFPSIPWNAVLEIVLERKKSSSPSQEEEINDTEIRFFDFLLTNQNMEIKNALMIFDLVSKVFMEKYHYSGYLTKIIVKIVDLFVRSQPIVQQLAAKLIKVCLAIHHANTKKFSHKRKSLTGNSKITQEQVLMKIKNNSIQFLVLKIAQIHSEQLNQKIQPLVAFSYIQMKDRPEYLKGFRKVLDILGDFQEIIQKFEGEIRRAQEDAKDQQRLQKLMKDKQKQREKQKMSQSKIVSKAHPKHRYQQQPDSTTKEFTQQPLQGFTSTKDHSISLHNRPLNTSFLGVTQSAQKGIQKFQKVYLTKIQRQDFEKIRRQQEQQREQLMKRIYKKKMMSQYGIDIKGETDQIQYLFQFNSQDNVGYQKKLMKLPYYTNQTQEDRDMVACDRMMKTYQKPLKVIFSLYSGQKKGNMLQNFDQIAEKNIVIGSSSVYKLMKDFGFQDFITLRQIQQLTQKINIQNNPNTADYQLLELQGFIEFIKQASFLMFTRPPKDLRGHPLTMMLEETFSNLKLFAAQNKVNDQIFEEPGNIFFNETEAVAELNRKLIRNPDYILPQGYKKIVDKKIVFEYGIYLEALSETYKVVFEVVDQLLYKSMGIHVMEPFAKEEKVTRARPALFVAERLKIDSMPAMHIPVNLKRQIVKMPIKSRTEGKQCAIVLDNIITAIQMGHDQIGMKHYNKVETERRKQNEQQKRLLSQQKKKRQNRIRQTKTALQHLKDQRQQQQKQKSMKKQQQQRKLKQEKQKKQRQTQQLKRKIQDYNKKKKQQQQEKLRKKKQYEEREKREREKLKQMNQETKRRLQEEKRKKEEEENAKKTEKEQEEKRLKQLEKKKMQQSQLVKKKMVEEFKLRKSHVMNSSTANKTPNKEMKNLETFGRSVEDAE